MDFIPNKRLNYRNYAEFPKSLFFRAQMQPSSFQALMANPDFVSFIRAHASEEVSRLALQFHGKTSFPLQEALEQIRLRQKAIHKIPEWVEAGCFLTSKGLEQCSSSLTAHRKAEEALKNFSVCHMLDCNGGLGVDAWAFSQQGARVTVIEQDPVVADLHAWNQKQLHQTVEVHQGEVLTWLDQNPHANFDLVYADPDRRSDAGKRLAHPDELNPPVSKLLNRLQGRCRQILLKMSPLFDPWEGINIFPFVKEVWILSTRHECREILYLLEPGYQGEVNFLANAWFRQRWFYGRGKPEFPKDEWQEAPLLYVTDTAFVLSGLTPVLPGIIARLDRGLYALAEKRVEDFPGIPYRVLHRFSEKGKALLKAISQAVPEKHVNISAKGSRYHPEELFKTLGKKSGGNKLILFRPGGESEVLLLEKVTGG
jgi:hypothetical protein